MKLNTIILHHGSSVGGGHYTLAEYDANNKQFISHDDSTVGHIISENTVLMNSRVVEYIKEN